MMDLLFGKRFFFSVVLLGALGFTGAVPVNFTVCVSAASTLASDTVPGTETQTVLWARPDLVQEVLDGKRTEAVASWWGFDAEDSTRFLQAALDSGVKKLTIDRQASEWIVRPLSGASNLELVLQDGVVILAKRGEYLGTSDALLRLRKCENVIIRGESPSAKAVLRMWKSDYQKAPYHAAEWRHGLSILSSKNVLVQDLTIEYTGGDGIYLGVCERGVTNENVTIRRVDCNENHRQGISVISAKDLLIEDTLLRNTNGTAPQAGIDFEPNHNTEELTNCVMRRCVCEGNYGDGYEFYLPNLDRSSPAVSILLEDCVSRGNRRNGIFWTAAKGKDRKGNPAEPLRGTLTVRNFTTENETQCGILLRGNPIDSAKLEFENVEVKKPMGTPILLSSNLDIQNACGNVKFTNVRVIDENHDRPIFEFRDISAESLGMAEVEGEILCERNGKTEKLTFTPEWIRENYPIKNTRRLPILPFEVSELVPYSEPADGMGETNIPMMRIRHDARFLFFAKAGERLGFTIRHTRVGRQDARDLPMAMVAPDGKKIPLEPLPFMKSTAYEIEARQTGIYVLECMGSPHSFHLEKTTVPVSIDASKVNFLSAVGNIYFMVPKGTKEFGVCISASDGERASAAVYAPNGEKRWEMDPICSTEFFYPSEEEALEGGIWRIQFRKPKEGGFEDFFLRLQNIQPIIAQDPELLLIEK
ncbi:MAG: right-handed parallel beta-helix repeat-containing protein [Thermoguttaceae bacterium]|nr:right-handed parallel beta-helix repeat-containing protein [Thermoguttaceae bacterium]